MKEFTIVDYKEIPKGEDLSSVTFSVNRAEAKGVWEQGYFSFTQESTKDLRRHFSEDEIIDLEIKIQSEYFSWLADSAD